MVRIESTNFTLAGVADGSFYFRSTSKLLRLNLQSQVITGEISELEHGSSKSLASHFRAMDISSAQLWVYDGRRVWRIGLEDEELAWAKMSHPHVQVLTVVNNRLHVWSWANNVISLREWDVSGF